MYLFSFFSFVINKLNEIRSKLLLLLITSIHPAILLADFRESDNLFQFLFKKYKIAKKKNGARQ